MQRLERERDRLWMQTQRASDKLVPFDKNQVGERDTRRYLVKADHSLSRSLIIWGPPKSGKASGHLISLCVSHSAGR